ncbi:MAG: hypothetical protein AAFR59_00580 [Bacteroidota bacterium]
MKYSLWLFLLLISSFALPSRPQTVHVMVALCDNEHQGIVPVPASLGKGDDPARNLYWGAGYGVKTFFDKKTSDWILIQNLPSEHSYILDRRLFKHRTKDVYLLAEAYDGAQMKVCLEDFLHGANGQREVITSTSGGEKLRFGGQANVLCFVGHNGLMDVQPEVHFHTAEGNKPQVIILGCYSRMYFEPYIRQAQTRALLWTTHLMAPEAYSLKAALDGWILSESGIQIRERAAQAYHQYQKCGIKGARNLFATGM